MPSVARSPQSSSSQPEARLLGGRYSLTRRIAIGGMGEVWAATDTVLGRQVAVKILRDELVDSPTFLARFRAEARHTASLAHAGIAGVFDYGEDQVGERCVAYLVMELVAGQPLSKVMADRGTLPVETVLSLMAQTAAALHAAHTMGVVHRDVKPGNLLLLDDGTIKVTDFGIARAANSVPLTDVGQVLGTARYMSPEQATGAEATPASDVYSLGVIGYEMLAGRPPFAADNPAALAMAHIHQPPPPLPPTVPPGVRAAIGEALSKNAADRPRDAQVFARRLRALQAATPLQGTADGGTSIPVSDVDDIDALPTRVMGYSDGSHTEIMPTRAIVAGAPSLGLAKHAHEPRRQRRRIAIAGLATVIVLVALSRLGALGASDLDNAPTPSTSPTSALVTVDASTLVGLPVAQASQLLSDAGLVVAINPVDAAGVPPGTVAGVEPSGQVPPRSTVTLDVSNGATTTTTIANTTTTEKEKGHGKGHKPKG